MKKNNKGFTLAELLIVVAIIGVLIAIAMPTFTGQLDRAKKRADLANLRAAYAQATAEYLEETHTGSTVQVTDVELSGKLEKSEAGDLPFTISDTELPKNDAKYKVTFTFPTGTNLSAKSVSAAITS